MALALLEFLDTLDLHASRIPLDVLRHGLMDLDIAYSDVRKCVRFSDERYQRNLFRAGNAYQALVLCWRNGQRSPIHDHRGSSCGVRVLRGTATETIFERNQKGLVYPAFSRQLAEGSVAASQDADIHQMSNLSDDGLDLVTLHIYSPPLLIMGSYSLSDAVVGEFVDPIYEFSQGAGI